MIMNTLQTALEILSERAVPVIAGGTDVYPALADSAPPVAYVDIRQLAELRDIHHLDTGGVKIGAGASWMDLQRAKLPAAFEGLRAAAKEVGSVQIQHRATVVGNLCTASPAGDGVPPLLTLDARIHLASLDSTRQMPLSEFILGPRQTARRSDELVVAIEVPATHPATVSGFAKLGSRKYLVISIAMVAMTLTADASGHVNRVAIAVGACSPVAQRLPRLESRLLGCSLQEPQSLQRCIDADCFDVLAPIDDVRGSAGYRLQAVQALVQRLLASTAERALRVQE